MPKALLFDMDGTLIDIDFVRFMAEYMARVVARFTDVKPAAEVQKELVAGTLAMMRHNDPERLVLDSFIDYFFPALGLPSSEITRFEAFYRTEYRTLQWVARPVPGARELLEAAAAKGLKVAVATAPLFPEIAIRERLRWGGLDGFPFSWVAAADTMHYPKPTAAYFLEICERLDVSPLECIMIGDELPMDGAAARVGMRTLLVGPEHPSHMLHWFPAGAIDSHEADVPRYPSLQAAFAALQSEGVL